MKYVGGLIFSGDQDVMYVGGPIFVLGSGCEVCRWTDICLGIRM